MNNPKIQFNREQQVLKGWRKEKTSIFKIMDRSSYKKNV